MFVLFKNYHIESGEHKASGTDWDRLAKQADQDIDTRDMPELGEDFFRRAELREPVKPVVTICPGANEEDA